MLKSEIAEIKKQFTHANSSITKVCGCYVDANKEIKSKFTESFLTLPEEETFKYFEIFKKTLSCGLGKNLINMEFPISAEFNGGTQETLLKLRDSELKEDELIDQFYDKVISSYESEGNYLILLHYAAYDVPGKGKDHRVMDDASDEVFRYILCSICPVKLTKPGLSYNDVTNVFQARIQDWVVGVPENGFIFPAFNDRSTDLHGVLYFTKNSEEGQYDFVDTMLGADIPLPAGIQKQTFQSLIEETLQEECEYETVRSIHEKLNELIEEKKDIPEPVTLDKTDVKNLFIDSGVEEEKLANFDEKFEETIGDGKKELIAANLINTKSFEIKAPDIVIKVNPAQSHLVETKVVDGRKCLVIAISEQIEVNGIAISSFNEIEDNE